MATVRNKVKPETPKRPPATTIQARENQLIAITVNLAEKQIRDGTASSQIITHFLKLGTAREELERDKLRNENELLKARVDAIVATADRDIMYGKAIDAMRLYSGEADEEEYRD